MPSSTTSTDRKLDQLIHSIEILVDIVEKRGRTEMSSSMIRYAGHKGGDNDFLRNRSSFNNTDFVNLMDETMKELEGQLKIIKDTKTKLEEQLKDTSLTKDKRDKINDKITEIEKEELEIEKRKRDGIEKEFKRRQKLEEEKLKEEYKNFTDEKKALYGNDVKNYVNFKIGQADYLGATSNRNDASRMIAESGLGNTVFGRYAQTMISRQQRIDDIANFGDKLQTGGAEQIAQAMGGGKTMVSALGGLGKGISTATKYLGPFGQGLQLAWDGVKKFAQVIGWANAYITKLVNLQSDLNEMSYQRMVNINTLINERQVETAKYIGDLHLKQVEIEGQNLLQAVDIVTKQFVKATEIAVGPLTKGINETAYDAANAYLDYQAEMAKFGQEREMRGGQLERFQQKRGIEYENAMNVSSREEERVQGKYDYDTILKSMEGEWTRFNDYKGRFTDWVIGRNDLEKKSLERMKLPDGSYSDTKESVFGKNRQKLEFAKDIYRNWMLDAMGAGFKDKGMGILKNQLQPELFAAEYGKEMAQWEAQRTNTIANIQEQAGNKQVEIATDVAKKYIDASNEVKKMWLQLAQKTEQWLDKFDQVTNDLGVNLGYTSKNKLESFQDTMFEVSKVAAKFGKSFEDAAKMQQAFVENTGRNKIMGQRDYGNLFGLGKYLGDENLAANYASEMEIFNTGVSDSVDMLDDVLQDVNKIGLNGRKYTKTLVDNLKLAQKYQFKDGTKGLMRMAKWAENTRFNLAALAGMLDKVREGGLEGVITQGAQFQVLGGHAAMNADPLAMMYEAYADPEAYGRRMQDMTKGYGRVDKKTGETKFSHTEAMMLQQIAKVQGRSLEDVQNEVRARNKREVVARQLSGNFDADQQAFISNNATYNKETGRFEVKVKGANGQYIDKDVSQLTEKDLDKLMPEQHNERMEDYMATVIDYLAKMTGEENLEKTMIGQELSEDRKAAYLDRLQTAHENFVNNFETYAQNARDGMQLANQKFSDYIAMWQNNEQAQGPGLDQINAATSNIASALGETASVISQANQKIAESIERAKFGGNTVNGLDTTEGFLNISNSGGKVTKINDGLVKADPKDVGVFAKEGGVIGNFLNDLSSNVNSLIGGGSVQSDNMKLEISGNLNLSSGGQSINIITELQNNPVMLRTLTNILAEQISSKKNGGKHTV